MAGVQVSIGGNAGQAISALQTVASKAESVAQKIKTGFQFRIGQKMFDGLSRAGASIPAVVNSAIQAASDLNEEIAKSEQVFQGSAGEMQTWAAGASRAFGLSKQGALEAAGGIGNLLRAMKIAPDQAAAMSRQMVELAADLASFNNTSVEDAVAAIGSAMRGEAEPIRRYGVLLNESTLTAEAMAKGLHSGKGALDPVTKAMSAYSLILENTQTAQGDFARTSDGLANTQRILKAQIGDAAAELGAALLPAMQELAGKISSIDLAAVGKTIGFLIKSLAKIAPYLAAVGAGMIALKISSFISSLAGKTRAWWTETAAIKANTTALRENASAGAAGKGSKGPSRGAAIGGGGALAIAGVAAGLAMKYAEDLKRANDAMDESFDRGNDAMQKFQLSTLRAQLASREEIKKTIAAIDEEKDAIYAAAEAQLKDVDDPETVRRIQDDTDATVKALEQKQKALNNISDAQLSANAATRAASEAEAAHAAAVTKAAEDYVKARAAYQQKIDTADEDVSGKGSLADQMKQLSAAEAAIRGKLSGQDKGGSSANIVARLDKTADSPEKTKDLELAIKLEGIEKRRVDLAEKLAEESQKTQQTKRAALDSWTEEMKLLTAQLKGQGEKVKELEREAEIRAEIARLTAAGHTTKDATVGATRLVDARIAAKAAEEAAEAEEKAADARANNRSNIGDAAAAIFGGGEQRGIDKRAEEISKDSGIGIKEAKNIAANESDLEKITGLKSQMDSLQFQSTIGQASDMQRVGGGGGVVGSGIDLAKQQADLQRQMVALLGQMVARTPQEPISDF